MTLRFLILGYVLFGASARASIILPYLKAGCPVFLVDKNANLAVTPWSCLPEAGDYICESAKKPCKRVGQVQSILRSSYPRDLNLHMFRVRPFYRRMDFFTEVHLPPDGFPAVLSQGSNGQTSDTVPVVGIATNGKIKQCTLKQQTGVTVTSLDDIRTTNILRDQIINDETSRNSVETRCSGFLTEYQYLPRQRFQCNEGESDVYALVHNQTLIGTIAKKRQEKSCKKGFPEYLTLAGQFHENDGLNHNYFNRRVRDFSGKAGGSISWPYIEATSQYPFFTPLSSALLLNSSPSPLVETNAVYSTNLVYALRQNIADAKLRELDYEQFTSTAAYLNQVFKAHLQRKEYNQLPSIHLACDEFHRLVLNHVPDPILAAGLLPECGHQLSALHAIILQMKSEFDFSPKDWVGHILSPSTAFAVIDTLQSKQPELFTHALEVHTAKELKQFRAKVAQPSIAH